MGEFIVRNHGAKLDPPGAYKTGLHVLVAKARFAVPAVFPRSLSWASYVLDTTKGGPGILDQHDAGACTGMAKAGSIMTRLAIMKTPVEPISPIAIYNGSLRLDRIPSPDGSLSALADVGAASNLATRQVQEWGACSVKAWGVETVSSAACIIEPTEAQLDAESQFQVTGSYGILTQGDAKVVDKLTALVNGYLIEETIFADTAFQAYTGGIITAPSNWSDQSKYAGWHRIYTCGYSWDGSNLSSVVFQFVQSWGSWGERDVITGISPSTFGFWRAARAWSDQLLDQNVQNITATGVEV